MIFPAPPNPYLQPEILYVVDEGLGYRHLPAQRGWIDGGLVTINSRGFRGPEPAIPRPEGERRIAVLGDSITLGWGVGDDETFCAQLEELLRLGDSSGPVVVLNLGVSGYSTQQEVTLANRLVPLLEPDVVLVGFYVNDLLIVSPGQDASSADGATVVRADQKAPGDILRMFRPDSSALARFLRSTRLGYLAGRGIGALRKPSEDVAPFRSVETAVLAGSMSESLCRAWEAVEEQLSSLRALGLQRDTSLGIVALPCREQVVREYPNAQYQSRLRAIAERLGYFFVDPLPRFVDEYRRSGTPAFVPYDRHHPDATGHRIIAESIAEYLRKNPDLPAGRPTPEGT